MYIFAQCTNGGLVQRDDSLLPLTVAFKYPARKIEIIQIQVDQLTDPDAGGIQQLQHSSVPVTLQICTIRLL